MPRAPAPTASSPTRCDRRCSRWASVSRRRPPRAGSRARPPRRSLTDRPRERRMRLRRQGTSARSRARQIAPGAPRRATAVAPAPMDWFSKRPHDRINAPRAGARPSVSRVSACLLIGEFPRPEDIPWLQSEFGVTAVHNLQDDEDFALNGLRERELREACSASGIKFVRTQIPDGSADAMAERLGETLEALARLIR